jgi:hypothetical protein
MDMKKNKVQRVFDKLKARAERVDPRLNEQDDEVDKNKLSRDAMKSLHFLPDVIKTDGGFEVV